MQCGARSCPWNARNVGRNVMNSQTLDEKVPMYVYEEIVDGRKLTEIINTTHMNAKYMPNFELPPNIIPCSVLVGCNLPYELAHDHFAEGTVGCRDQKYYRVLHDIFKSPTFRVVVTEDADCVEICSTLRNIIAFAAGCSDGMELNENTKGGIIRRGFLEMLQFVDVFYPGCRMGTFFESCGISDLVTSCYANRNRKLAEAFVKTGKPLSELEHILIPGHEPLGPVRAELVHHMLKKKGLEDKFPLFTCVYRICTGDYPLHRLVETLIKAREDIFHPLHTVQL
ncbi:glycerol-3-phosphate dehydrogenase [NAD(+)], cytoplasmic-like [Drosophila suzukii]|uniref:glycerol-3-phosphate dehydrogenase (NAD(+)) n=1 Tax=Drosophila suzukii TaxID=28584 RepID=A0ABM4TW59_DROSZ